MIWTALLRGLGFLLIGLSVWLAAAVSRRTRARQAAQLPAGMRILAADLGERLRSLGRGGVTLRDNEWGIAGKVDLVLETPNGYVPVEYKQAGPSYEPGTAKPGHVLQLATSMLLCEGDGRFGKRPAEGWLRYLDGQGRLLPGGEVRIANTPRLRDQVIASVQRMRRALVSREELHRDHQSAAKCAKCSRRLACDEGIV
ncbi:MAG: PD-(D/E)XK nuclease family protein [Candidatus Methylomirabilota bacterium]|jgi:CRISPR/Cas system-associated exonuclease Cas4 (RecB family)